MRLLPVFWGDGMSQLTQVAGEMRRVVEGSGARFAHYKLRRGLEVVLERRGEGRWRLALGRVDVAPSAVEVEVCRVAFGAPEGSEPVQVVKERAGKTGTVRYFVAELTWVER